MPGAAGQLKALYKQLIGGTSPGSTGSLTGDLSEQIQALIDRLLSTTDLGSFTGSATGSLGEQLAYIQANLGGGPPMLPYWSSLEIVRGMNTLPNATTAIASTAWSSSNRAVLVPFVVSKVVTSYNMWLHNGITVSGNLDMGIYDDAFTKVVSMGSTAQSGASTIQTLDIADTALDPGLYYAALVMNGTVGTAFQANFPAGARIHGLGMARAESAFPLPSSVTPLTTMGFLSDLPYFGISFRSAA